MAKGKGKDVIIPEPQSVYYSEETGTESIVLEDVFNPDYEPAETEILEYAAWLEMDIENDGPLMWIACEGLKTPLPENWRPIKTGKTDIYYFNFQTGESIWDHPLDEKFKTLYKRESQKRREGKPFKTGPDDETYEFLHGHPPPKDKKKSKKEKKESRGGLPDTLTRALSAAEKKDDDSLTNVSSGGGTRSKGKFGNLPSNPYKMKGSPLGPLGGDDPVSASALGRAALPGLGAARGDSAPTSASSHGLKPRSTPTSIEPKSSFSTNSATEKSLEDLKAEYQKLAEEERRSAEQQRKRLKRQLDQELQDLELDLESKKNQIRRENLNQQNAWEQQIDEKRRSYESQLLSNYESWKKERDNKHNDKVEQYKDDLQRNINDLTKKQQQMLDQLKEDHEQDIESQRKSHLSSIANKNDTQLADLKRQHETAVANLRNDTEEEKRQLQRVLEADIQKLKEQHKKEEQEFNKRFNTKKASATAETTRLEEQLRTSRASLEQITSAIEKERESIEEVRQARPLSSMSHLSEEMEEELASARLQHEQQTKKLDEELSVRKHEIDMKIAALEQETQDKENRLHKVTKDLEDTKTTIEKHAPELELPQSGNEEHEAEKKKIQTAIEQLKSDHAAQVRQLEEEFSQKEQSLTRILKEATDHHTLKMSELQSTFAFECQSHRSQLVADCEASIKKEQARLEREAIKQIETHAKEVNDKLTQQKNAEQEKMNLVIQKLNSESEKQKRLLIEQEGTELSTTELEAKIASFKQAEQEKLEAVMKQITAESKIQEAQQREQIHREIQSGLKQFRENEEAKLKNSCDEARRETALKLQQITDEMNSQLESKRSSVEDQIAQSRKQLELRQQQLQQQQQHDEEALFAQSPKFSEQPSPSLHHRSSSSINPQHLEKDQLRQAKSYLRIQKKELKNRQDKLHAMRQQWDADVDALRGSDAHAHEFNSLRKVRLKLDKKAQELNAEVKALQNREYWLRQRIAKMGMESECETSISDITIPEKPRRSRRGRYRSNKRDKERDHFRGGDPRVLMVLSSLSNQVSSLQRKLSKMEDRRHGYRQSYHTDLPDTIDHWKNWLQSPRHRRRCW
eukprot:TRINITY_DN11774_c1_g1_i1.p1 TRINITY_DN11774_c1_g1~~TRINITY_DN11774_c1_g1_i1.p1  ORF type:complete len:1087 (+),score=301.72 TRINITY_DN11774_c1_g1_i1:76-3336(+)